MKKIYKKPMIVVESFELTEHIASCGSTTMGNPNAIGTPNHSSGVNCEFLVTGGNGIAIFLESNHNCNIEVQVDDDGSITGGYQGCYNTPDGNVSMFAS